MDFTSEWREVEAQVRRFCRSRARDRDTAEDILQATSMRAWNGYASFQRRSSS